MPEKKQSTQCNLVPNYSAGSQYTKFCFSHDSRYLFCCCGSVVKVFNTANGELLHDLIGHKTVVTGVAINPANVLQIYTCCEDGYLLVWDYLDGAKLKEYYLHMALFGIVSIHDKTGAILMIARTSMQDSRYGLLQWTRKGGSHNEFSPPQVLIPNCNKDQKLVSFGCQNSFAATAQSSEVTVCSVKTGKIRTLKDTDTYNKDKCITSLACQPNEYCIAAGIESGRILLWYNFFDNRDAKYSILHWHSVAVLSLGFSPDGSILLSGGHECVFVRWQMNHHHEKDFKPRMGAPLSGVASSPDGKFFATRHQDNVLQVLDTNLTVLHIHRGISRPNWTLGSEQQTPIPSGLLYDPRSRCLVTNGMPGHLQFYSLALRKQLYNLDIVGQNYISPENVTLPPVLTRVMKAALSQDGRWLASFEMWDDGGTFTPELRLKFWCYSPQQHTYVLNTVVESPHDAQITSMCFRPSPPPSDQATGTAMLVTTGSDHCFKLWTLVDDTDIYRENQRWTCDCVGFYRDMECGHADFSCDGSSLAVTFDHLVTLWDPESNVVRTSVSSRAKDKHTVRCVKFGRLNCRFLLVAMSDRELVSYNLLSLTVEWSLPLACQSVLIRDPASDLMATVSGAGTLCVFTPKSPDAVYSHQQITKGDGEGEAVLGALFAPDSRPEDTVDVGWPGTSQIYLYTHNDCLVTLQLPHSKTHGDKVKIHQSLPQSDLSVLMAQKVVRDHKEAEVKDTQRRGHVLAGDEFVSTMLHTNEPMAAFCDQFINRLLVKKKGTKSRKAKEEEGEELEDEEEEDEAEEDGSDSEHVLCLTDTAFDPVLCDFLKEESATSQQRDTQMDSLLSGSSHWVSWCRKLSL